MNAVFRVIQYDPNFDENLLWAAIPISVFLLF